MSLRVLHVTDHLGPGGAQVLVKNIVENINDKEIETFICALRTNLPTIAIKAKIISLRYCRYDPRLISTIIKLCKEHKIDILHAHLQKSIIGCLLASYFCKIPTIIHEHGAILLKGITFSIYSVLLRILHHRAAVIIANSQAAACKLTQRAGIDRDKIEIVYNAVDFARFDRDKTSPGRMRKKLEISEADIVIGFVGRLHKVKGADILIEAVALLLQQSPRYLLVLAGDGPERKSLESLASRLGISDHVRFLGTCTNIPELISAFDIGVVPSRHESFGIVALEIMRMKKPVVCSGVDGLAELVTDGVTGLVTRENRPEEIAATILRLANDRELQEKLIEKAYSFSKQFEIREHVKKLQKIYERYL